jgi:uncharacterized protein (TIGR02118 family)
VYKVIWLVRFRQDRDTQEVLDWWRGHHAELARSTPGMTRYVQSYWSRGLDPATQMPDVEPRFDGHAEHWFESFESYREAMASPEWRATIEDGPSHFDSSTLVGGELDELVVTWTAGDDARTYGDAPASAT